MPGLLQLLWLDPEDSWMRYMRTYVAGVRHLYRYLSTASPELLLLKPSVGLQQDAALCVTV